MPIFLASNSHEIMYMRNASSMTECIVAMVLEYACENGMEIGAILRAQIIETPHGDVL